MAHLRAKNTQTKFADAFLPSSLVITSCLLSHLNVSVPAVFVAQLSQNARNGADLVQSLHLAKVSRAVLVLRCSRSKRADR
jgi:hypothetical protein